MSNQRLNPQLFPDILRMYLVEMNPGINGADRLLFKFENNLGASIIYDSAAHGTELASVLFWDTERNEFEVQLDNPVCSGKPLEHLTDEELVKAVEAIRRLPEPEVTPVEPAPFIDEEAEGDMPDEKNVFPAGMIEELEKEDAALRKQYPGAHYDAEDDPDEPIISGEELADARVEDGVVGLDLESDRDWSPEQEEGWGDRIEREPYDPYRYE